MPTFRTQPVEEVRETGQRLKKFNRDECDAIVASGVIDVRPLELIEGDILVKHTPIGPQRRRWTVDEVEALRESGAIDVDRLELVEGELYDKIGKNRPHVNAQHRILKILVAVFGIDRVTTESAITAAEEDRPTSEPEPDIIVTTQEAESFKGAPQARDICLIVEVSDTTLRYDLRIKAGLYARAGIVEYWGG